MVIFLCVEGPSDAEALNALLGGYRARCRVAGWGLKPVNMHHKSRLLSSIGSYSTARLTADQAAHVVAMPDLYPTAGYVDQWAHRCYDDLCEVLRRCVALEGGRSVLERFHPHPFCHDLEVLLLAVPDRLRQYLRTRDRIERSYAHPAEDQDDHSPPKRKVEEFFRTRHYRKTTYKDVVHAPAVLGGLDLSAFYANAELPRFGSLLRTLETITGVPI